MKEQRRKTHLRINYQDLVQMTVMMMTLRYCWNLHLIVTLFLLTFFCISVVCTYGDFGFYLAKCQLLYHLCLQRKKTGVEGLIEIENPNRVAQKSKKVTQIELDEPRQLSRRERFVSANIQQELWFSLKNKLILPSKQYVITESPNRSNWNSSCNIVEYYCLKNLTVVVVHSFSLFFLAQGRN